MDKQGCTSRHAPHFGRQIGAFCPQKPATNSAPTAKLRTVGENLGYQNLAIQTPSLLACGTASNLEPPPPPKWRSSDAPMAPLVFSSAGKVAETARDGPRWPRGGPRWPEMARDGPRWPDAARDWLRLPEAPRGCSRSRRHPYLPHPAPPRPTPSPSPPAADWHAA